MIQVSVPATDNIKTETVASLVDMMTYSTIKGIPAIFNYAQGSQLDRMRNMLVEDALKAKHSASHVLFIDSDQVFPSDTLERLLSHKKDIVGSIITQRKPPFMPNCSLDGKHLYTDGKTGVQKVNTLGTGLMLIKAEVFKWAKAPWFLFGWDEERQMHRGEDIHFCNLASKAGFDVWADHDLSKEVTHLGSVQMGWREAMEARDGQGT